MSKNPKLKHYSQRIASLFSVKRNPVRPKGRSSPKFMRLNFFLLSAALEHIKGESSRKGPSLFTKKILTSDNKHLSEIVKQADSCCSRQDLHLMSYKQFSLRDEFSMKRVIEWKLSKYMRGEEQIRSFIQKMKESTPAAFRRHLITLLNEEKLEISQDELERELKRQEESWNTYQHHGDGGPTTISSV